MRVDHKCCWKHGPHMGPACLDCSEYMATLLQEPFCAFVEYVDARVVRIFKGTPDEYTRKLPAGYQPSFNVSEDIDVSPSNGTPMSTPEHAAQAAISLSQLHLRAVARPYRPFGEGADCVVEIDAPYGLVRGGRS